MGDTSIEWTRNSDGSKGKSWNPIAAYFNGKRGWMCSKPSTGCKHCYSERLNQRLGNGLRYTAENAAKVEWRLVNLDEPGKWRKPQKCFVESMGDLFHELIPDEMIGWIWSKMLEFPQHTFQVLTKRPGRMRELVTRFTEEAERKGLRSADHIWLGTSVENQEQADKRIPELLKIPAAVHFLSCEPLLSDVKLPYEAIGRCYGCQSCQFQGFHQITSPKIQWVIVGGESGPNARPMHPDWVRNLRGQCQAAGVPFFFKQWGEWEEEMFSDEHAAIPDSRTFAFESDVTMVRTGKKAAGRILDGRTWDEFPEA